LPSLLYLFYFYQGADCSSGIHINIYSLEELDKEVLYEALDASSGLSYFRFGDDTAGICVNCVLTYPPPPPPT
jgi:hypothetical protein